MAFNVLHRRSMVGLDCQSLRVERFDMPLHQQPGEDHDQEVFRLGLFHIENQ
jgi:hypothetical protein